MLTLVVCVLGAAFACVWAQDNRPSISEIEIRAGERGMILIITGTGAIALGGRPADLEQATASYPELRLKIANARSGLGANAVFTGPDALPLREIILNETPDGVGLAIKMRTSVRGPVDARSSNNQVRLLLTRDPQPEITWSSSRGLVASGQPAAQPALPAAQAVRPAAQPAAQTTQQPAAQPAQPARPAAQSAQPAAQPAQGLVLNNIRVVERDNTAAMHFDFSAVLGTPSARAAGDSIQINFPAAALSPRFRPQTYVVSGSEVYASVRVSQSASGVAAVIKLRRTDAQPIFSQGAAQYSVHLTMQGSARIHLWNALEGVQSSHSFTNIQAEPVDMQRIGARASGDINSAGAGQTFPVSGGAQAQRGRGGSGAAPAIIVSRSEVPQAESLEDDSDIAPDGETTRQAPHGELVRYRVFGRDPFVPLVRDTTDGELPRVENLRLVGVLEDSRERIALLEDFRNSNRAFALRTNDPVESGKVLRIQRDRVVFLIRDFDVSRSFTLNLNANR
jgi:hypothetical protein